jgi:hypothetical protein
VFARHDKDTARYTQTRRRMCTKDTAPRVGVPPKTGRKWPFGLR